jgi:Protein of unknown function (DUF3300)
MKKRIIRAQAFFLSGCVLVGICSAGRNEVTFAKPTSSTRVISPQPDQKFSDDELDELLSPIALYPDPLLAQVVPASTFVEQLQEANRVLGGKSDDNLIANQSWDVSVKSVAHYPQVLQMMVQKIDWTTTLGQAYVNQSTDVGKAIQRLRAEAKSAGYLTTTSQQQVITEGQVIRIEPAQPQVIYVPQYNPEVVYVDSGPSTGAVVAASAISFGVGLAIGAWLNNDWDYYGRGIYYHGWVGGGWIGRSNTFVSVNRNIYVNNSYRNINVNRNVVRHNTTSYRNNLTRNATVRRDRVNASRRNTTSINNRANNIRENSVSRRARTGRTDALRNRDENRQKLDSHRSRENQNVTNRRESNSAFGGSGNRQQVRQQSARGGQSLQKMNSRPHRDATTRNRPSGGADRSGGRRRKG